MLGILFPFSFFYPKFIFVPSSSPFSDLPRDAVADCSLPRVRGRGGEVFIPLYLSSEMALKLKELIPG
jgi:hypothetical protein